MKKILFLVIFLISLIILSCSHSPKTSNSNDDLQPNNEISEIQLHQRVLKRDINNSKWYLACHSNDYNYYSFKDGRICHQSGTTGSNLIYLAEGNYYFIENSQTKFKYKWDTVAGDPYEDEILLIDDDILILATGFDYASTSRIGYKDLSAYTENTPFMGLGKFNETNWSEWVVFTPSGNCYKRYKDFNKQDYYIACGRWKKDSDNTFKVFWTDNTDDYDILKGKLLYQNINKNPNVIPITLYVKNF